MKKITPIVLVLVLGASLASAMLFKSDTINEGSQSLRVKDKSSGKFLWGNTITVKRIKHKGKPFVYIKETGQGIYGKDKLYQTWTGETYADIQGGVIRPYSAEIVFKNKAGKTVRRLKKFFDRQAGKVFCSNNGEKTNFDFKADLLDKNVLGIAMSNYPFTSDQEQTFHLMTQKPEIFKMTMKPHGKELVELDGRKIECYKMEMIPDLGALSIFSAFVPKTYFWYEVAKPHKFVRYEGLESGLGTPYVIMTRQSKRRDI